MASPQLSRFILQKSIFLIVVILFFSATTVLGQEKNYPPDIPGSKEETFKTIDGVDLKAWVI